MVIAQINILLPVSQNPVLGYTMSRADTTIEKGGTANLAAGIRIYGGSGDYSYLWTPPATISNPAVLNPRATPADTTEYLLTVTDRNGCSFSAKYKVNVKKTSVKSELILSGEPLQVSFFPNPGRGEFNLRLTGNPEKKINLEIFNYEGKLLYHRVIQNFDGSHAETINLSLESGIYSLRVNTGSLSVTRPFIVN
jgi:hypothetical protein